MKVKYRSKRGLFAVFCAFFVCFAFAFTTFFLVPKMKKDSLSISSSSFTEVTGQSNPVVSLSVVFRDGRIVEHGNVGVNDTTNGFSVFDLISRFDENDISSVSNFYVSLTFPDGSGFNFEKYNLYLTSANALFSMYPQAFDAQGRALGVDIVDVFLSPIDLYQVYQVTLTSMYDTVDYMRSIVFRFSGSYFTQLYDAYSNGLFDYYIFAFDKNVFVDFETAFNQGYDSGYDSGYETGSTDGYDRGYGVGYNTGYVEGSNVSSDFYTLISAVIDVPVQTFYGMFNFEIMGVNLGNFILSIMTASVVIVIIRFLV